MRGLPKHMNTKEDFNNLIDDYPNETKASLQELLNEKEKWLNTGLLDPGNEGITDETHKIVEVKNATGEIERYQYKYKEDPNAKIFRLGFTVSEVQQLLNS